MVTIYYNNTSIDVQEDDSTFRYRSIMGDCYVTLKFSLNKAIDFPVGTYIIYQGCTYTLASPQNWKRYGNQNIEYTLTLTGEQDVLKKYKLRNPQDGRLKFSMMSTPAEYLALIVDNLNASGRETGWSGTCLIDAEAKQIEFNHTYLLDALTDIADQFETEFEITESKVIRLGKVEYYKSDPLPLAYGRGKGFKPGTGRTNTDDSKPVEVLYVQGGEQNIDSSKYGSSTLLLPKGQTLSYEGRSYIASDDGFSIRRSDKALQYKNEDSIDLSDIYPSREGTVSSVVVVDAATHLYDFVDKDIPDALNYNDYLIDGETMTVIFQTGMLAGREFEISNYVHTEVQDGAAVAVRRFEIVPSEMDGYVMPCEGFLPAKGDKYAIFGCTLPDAYICDNETQTGAAWDMFREAARYMFENEDFKFTFSGELQGKWAKENWSTVGTRIVLGSYIKFTDDDFAAGGVDMRITGIKDYFNSPYSPTIEISNGVTAAGFSSQMREAEAQEVRIDETFSRSLSFTKRRWRDTRETMTALEEAMDANFKNYSSAVSPIAVQTMQLLVGDESLQFRFVTSKTNPTEESHKFVYDDVTKIFSTQGGIIQHMTLGINALKATHSVSEYKFWTISAFSSSSLGEDFADKKFYLYAKCSKSDETATFVLSETAIAIEGEAGYYHLLVGILNSEFEDSRSFVTVYGYTEILPGRVTTDKIVSSDGKTYFDLVNSIIGGNIKFVSTSGEEKNVNTLEADIEAAKTAAEEAKSELDSWASDQVVSPTEKAAIEQMGANIKQDYLEVVDRCNEYSVSTTSLKSAYTKAIAAVTKYTSTATELITIESDYDDIAAYWTTRKTTLMSLNDAISKKLSTMESDISDAAAEAAEAKTTLSNWASDGKISPTEKTALKEMEKQIKQDYLEVIDRCGKYDISTTTFTSAYNKAIKALDYYTAASTWSEVLTIYSDYDNIAAYWEAKKAILLTLNTAVKGTLTQLRTDVDDAAADAASAVATAQAAQDELTNWASDGNVTPVEKRSLSQMEEQIKEDYTEIVDRCTKYSITYSSLTTAYNNAISSLDYYTANPTVTTAISSSYPYSYIAAYWDARTTLLKTINTSLKDYTDGLVNTAVDNLTQAYQSGDEATIKEAETQVATLGETLIEGGLIKTIVMEALAVNVAKAVQVGTAGGQRVDILAENKSVEIYDSTGKLVQKLEGNSYTSLSKIFGSASGSFSLLTRSSTQYGYSSGTSLGKGKFEGSALTSDTYTEDSFEVAITSYVQTDTPTEVTIGAGNLYAYAKSGTQPTGTSSVQPIAMASAEIQVQVRTYSNSSCTTLIETVALAGAQVSAYYDGDGTTAKTQSVSLSSSKSVRVVAGYHKVYIKGSYVKSCKGAQAYVYWGTSTVLSSISYKSESYVSLFFANGFCLGTRSDNYIFAYNQSSSLGMRFVMENGGYGIDVSQNGIMVKHHSGNWLSLPLFIAKFRINCTSSSASLILHYSWNGVAPTVKRTARGTVTVTYPTSTAWTGLGLTSTNQIINAVGALYSGSTTYSKPTITAITATGFTLYLSDDDSLNDSTAAEITIYKISS